MNNQNKIRVRFAPSPTGFLHIGGARTCLFNWLYARKNNGVFVLRIEDTDLQRSQKEYLEEILESIQWLGMNWDELYHQSDRFDLYKSYAKKLVDEGKAYEKDGAIFFKYEFDQIEIDDSIRGKIVFNQLPKEEDVIVKSDGSPTYNFCCVIDDALMGITDVIRGEDHISNTPKQILIYKSLGFSTPRFAHVPLILSPDGGRLSKRFGATSIREYREMGYLSEAIVNYLMLLGWSPGDDKEIISLAEAKNIFDIKDVNKTGAAFSIEKLNWLNGEYIRKKDISQLYPLIIEALNKKNFLPKDINKDYLEKVIRLFKERMILLADCVDLMYFCFYNDYVYSPEVEKVLERDLSKEIGDFIEALKGLANFSKEEIEQQLRLVAQNNKLKAKDLVHPVRGAISGRTTGPGLFETIEVLGKDTVLNRLERLLKYWQDRNQQKN